MGLKTRLSSYCSKRGDNTVNLVTSRKTNGRLAHPILVKILSRGYSEERPTPVGFPQFVR